MYVALVARPWSSVRVGGDRRLGIAEGPVSVPDEHAGYLPIYWRREDAERLHPGAAVMEVEADDDWGRP